MKGSRGTEEPEYRTAKDKLVCPECGYDFTDHKSEAVFAHIEGMHPGFNRGDLDSDAAEERRARLIEIAQGLK